MRLRQIDQDSFDPTMYDLFWHFLVERQRIWVRRAHLQMDAPWTTDEVMRTEFITNVYRELDPGTTYVLDEINLASEKHIDIVFNIMMYRLMGSQHELHRAIGFQHIEQFSSKRFQRQINENGVLVNHKVFGSAYRVAGYTEFGATTKIDNVALVIKQVAHQLPEWHRRMLSCPSARDLFNVFISMKGFGDFLASQCAIDLLMLNERMEEPIWPFGTDEWVQPGPGAKRGIANIIKTGGKPANLQMVLAWLRDVQQDEFTQRDLTFPYLADEQDEPRLLSISNMQTTLCEFNKYVRARGKIRVRSVNQYHSILEPWAIVLNDDEIESLRDITAVTDGKTHRPHIGVHEIYPVLKDEEDDEVFVAPSPMPSLPDVVQTTPVLNGWQPMLTAMKSERKPMVIPIDPTGLLGLPKAVLVIPLD